VITKVIVIYEEEKVSLAVVLMEMSSIHSMGIHPIACAIFILVSLM